ncbi:MAG: SPOR domain-containing protein [Gemmatimonadaceae bacterium]
MVWKVLRILIAGVFAVSVAPFHRLEAQSAAAKPTAADSIFARARQLVVNGNGAAGRVLVDSAVAATDPALPAYAEALYWRATLAATSADAESDYQRIVVEYPLSPRESDALLQLAQLEIARGDRASAATHLERYVLENPKSADAGRAQLMLVRVSFEQNDLPHGCIALHRALAGVPATAVELHNQLDYYSSRCNGVDTTRVERGAAPTDSATPPARARDTSTKDTTTRATAKAGKYTLQVAAYTGKDDADRVAKKLRSRGLAARVVGTKKLFRVRIGRYETRAAAAAAAKELKKKKIDAFVTDIGADDR